MSLSSSSLPRYLGVVIATSVCNLSPKAASSSSRTQPIRTPFGPLYLNIFFLPENSVGFSLILPPTSSYNTMAICTPNSRLGTTMSASGFLTSVPEDPRVDKAAPVAMALSFLICCRAVDRTTGLVTMASRSNKSSPRTASSAPTRMR